MAEYFDIQIEGSVAAYLEESEEGLRFTDADGNTVDNPLEPIRYIVKSWCVVPPAWGK